MDNQNMYKRNSISNSEDPPMSRLFVIGPKTLTENDYRKHFEEFGSIEEIWMVNDKASGEYKGITYIKYSKTSEAACALEKMNGSALVTGTRRIKVMIAASRDQGAKRDGNEEEKMQRLFIVCPKTMREDDLYEHFQHFGDLDYINIVKDKNTRESKGIAYVKYNRFSDAAKAFEECDRKYKPVFAEPKSSEQNQRRGGEKRDYFGGPSPLLPNPASRSSSFNSFPMDAPGPSGINEGFTKLTVIASPDINQDQLWKLFDIVPGLDYCEIRYQGGHMQPARAIGEIVYASPQWAAHAKDKLHGFEYPPGFRLIVKPVFDGSPMPQDSQEKKKDIMQLAETIAQASSLIQAAGLDPSTILNLKGISDSGGSSVHCSAKLPNPKPFSSIDDECVSRCFIVCTTPISNSVLKDVFCRFGNLIDAYLLPNRNCGYARYSDRQSCEEAIRVLHGAEVNGVRLKVIVAEEPRKRQKLESPW
ncbi:unnamed protein product [Ceutorhynchus assimilis]|uniref:RRM domain-containing protein n=1 Tax=Ceutorhynchus assimilis TaxID=467358 RepID=A0A9N9QQU3_9CUCU|nr:unnamed protein product [Ceutorhynchus assimilis]